VTTTDRRSQTARAGIGEGLGGDPLRAGGLVFAVDIPGLDAAEAAVRDVGDAVDMIKVGLELFVEAGPAAVRLGELVKKPVFLDLKLHDIPETVDRAVARACALGVRLLTVHASGGAAMLERAATRADKEQTGLTIAAVTVLTSLDDADLERAGVTGGTPAHVLRLARLGWSAGVRAFVASPREVAQVRAALGPGAVLITPGIRPSDASAGADDQKRVATARQATLDGADWLVVGRPIRDAKDRRAMAHALSREIADARPTPAVHASLR
jgi:orotidine-5'-phosphate decarboxylase